MPYVQETKKRSGHGGQRQSVGPLRRSEDRPRDGACRYESQEEVLRREAGADTTGDWRSAMLERRPPHRPEAGAGRSRAAPLAQSVKRRSQHPHARADIYGEKLTRETWPVISHDPERRKFEARIKTFIGPADSEVVPDWPANVLFSVHCRESLVTTKIVQRLGLRVYAVDECQVNLPKGGVTTTRSECVVRLRKHGKVPDSATVTLKVIDHIHSFTESSAAPDCLRDRRFIVRPRMPANDYEQNKGEV
ncbi:MAG: hypothetical protein JHC26_07895, partial [Thermofilum sp.]|uniref:hypothetical protein n=1 Tax=Thermofilum sp. TaxID=1961369 RepID=UPI00258EA900